MTPSRQSGPEICVLSLLCHSATYLDFFFYKIAFEHLFLILAAYWHHLWILKTDAWIAPPEILN